MLPSWRGRKGLTRGGGARLVVVALVLANLYLAAGPLPIGLVHSGVRSVTVCNVPLDNPRANENYVIRMRLPGDRVGTCGLKKKGNCHVWYHYAE